MNKKIAIVSELYSQNLGDGAIYKSIEFLLDQYNIDVSPIDLSGRECFSNGNNINKKKGWFFFIKKNLREYNWIRTIYLFISWYFLIRPRIIKKWELEISTSDAVIIGGGQIMTDVCFSFPPKIYEIYRLAKKHNKPIAIFGCGVGKKWGVGAKIIYRGLIKYASFISVRDSESAARINRHLKLSECIDIHPDPVFIISEVYPHYVDVAPENNLILNMQTPEDFRDFVPELKDLHDQEYVEYWYLLATDALNCGLNVSILTNGDPDDYYYAKKVKDKLKDNNKQVYLFDRPTTPEVLIAGLSTCSFLISTRMHAGIIAHSLGAKVIPISWDDKVNNVWAQVGLSANVMPSSQLLVRVSPYSKCIFNNRTSNSTEKNKIFSAIEKCLSCLDVL